MCQISCQSNALCRKGDGVGSDCPPPPPPSSVLGTFLLEASRVKEDQLKFPFCLFRRFKILKKNFLQRSRKEKKNLTWKKAELVNGSYSRDMFKELEHSLKEERQRVIQLQEDLITVQAKLEEERQQKTGLQKQMELVEDGQKDDDIRDDEVGVLKLDCPELKIRP